MNSTTRIRDKIMKFSLFAGKPGSTSFSEIIRTFLLSKKVTVNTSSTLKNHLLSILTSTLFAPAVYFGGQFQNFTSPVSNFLLLETDWWTTDTPCMCASIVLRLNSNFPACSGLVRRGVIRVLYGEG